MSGTKLFRVGIWIKGIDGLLEMAGGLVFLFVSPATLGQLVAFLTQRELAEDPRDWVATHLRAAVGALSPSAKLFGSLYLLGHGFAKVFLMGALWRNQLWAYPTAIAFLLAFVGYQLYRLSLHASIALLLVTIADLVIIVLVWREYRFAKSNTAPAWRRY